MLFQAVPCCVSDSIFYPILSKIHVMNGKICPKYNYMLLANIFSFLPNNDLRYIFTYMHINVHTYICIYKYVHFEGHEFFSFYWLEREFSHKEFLVLGLSGLLSIARRPSSILQVRTSFPLLDHGFRECRVELFIYQRF